MINKTSLRCGITDYCEFRFGISYDYTWTYMDDECYKLGGLSDLSFGTKVKLYDGKGWIPKMALLATLTMPADKDFLPERVGGDFHLLFGNDLCDWCSLGCDVGYSWSKKNGEYENPLFFGVSLGFAPTDKLGLMVEEYNVTDNDNKVNPFSEFAVTYMVHPRVQLDAYTDVDWKNPGKFRNIGIGVAWRIK